MDGPHETPAASAAQNASAGLPTLGSIRQRTQLAALWAWAGLGANGLSAACYGPEKSYMALGDHAALGPLLALITAASVALIALAYRQMIEIFPHGVGSYRATTELLGPGLGLMSGAASLIDHVLAIAVSIASGADALFSLFPGHAAAPKLVAELGLAVGLVVLNLRGVDVAIRVLFPAVLAFLAVHVALIVAGVGLKAPDVGAQFSGALTGTWDAGTHEGWVFLAALLVRAYGLGGSTYSGVEAISNNVNLLAEPRAKTVGTTLLYTAISLALTAGGLILLYSLWQLAPAHGMTLNATVFAQIIAQLGFTPGQGRALLYLTLALEAGILFAAANSVLIFAPSLLASMASDSWLPHQFRNLSMNLVRQNGVLVIGAFAVAILYATSGNLETLVVFYSINVFISLALAKTGLARYWWRHPGPRRVRAARLAVAAAGLLVSLVILYVTLTERFYEGGWATLALTLVVMAACIRVRRHYRWVGRRRRELDEKFSLSEAELAASVPLPLAPEAPSAVLLTTDHWGPTLHTLLWVQRLFPGHFRNVIFIGVVEFDARTMGAGEALTQRTEAMQQAMRQMEAFCARHGLGTSHAIGYGTDPVHELERLAREVMGKHADSVCFANRLILPPALRAGEWLHNQTSLAVQRRLHAAGLALMVVPIRLG